MTAEKRSKNSLIERLRFFQSIVRKISERKPLEKLLDEIIDASKSLLNSEAASLLLYDRKDNLLHYHTVAGSKRSAIKARTIKIGEGIAGWIAGKRIPAIIHDCYSDKRFNREFDSRSGFKTRNMICVPMLNKKDLIGVIQSMNKKGDRNFNKEDLDLFEALAAQCAVAIENARLTELEFREEQIRNELETARIIQQRFIQQEFPRFDDIDFNLKLIPAREVGGDYYYVGRIDGTKTLFIIADVSGKSISAALIVSTLYSFINFYLLQNSSNFTLKHFVESFNKFLISSTTPDKFVTAWFGLLDHRDRSLISISAGHNPTYLLQNGSDSFDTLSAGGLMLGSIDLPYQEERILLKKGDLISLYTDGVTEAMNSRKKEFGEERFKKILIRNRNCSAQSIINSVIGDINKFRGAAEQSDDITIGIIKC